MPKFTEKGFYQIGHGDAFELLKTINYCSVHSIVTDPPYGLHLMSQSWDKILPPKDIWKQCFNILKPGGFCLAFGHTSLFHRLACDLEDVGFEICDCLCWGYATGAPRPYNIDKAIDKYLGVEILDEFPYQPKSNLGEQWKGWANILKTAWEPICMARKPVEKNLVHNILKYKVGALNIDECRIPYASEEDRKSLEGFTQFAGKDHGDSRFFSANTGGKKQCNVHPFGRWPANLLWLDPMFADYDHIFMIPKPGSNEKEEYNTHSTVKPVRLMERLISLVTPRPSVVKEDVYVVDPFMGSGTTGVACKILSRKFIGCEKDQDSFVTASRRLDEKIRRMDIFER